MNAPNRIPFQEVPPFLAGIPEPRFCLWKWECRGGKWTKPPCDPQGHYAKNNAPDTWLGLDDALNAYRDGHNFAGIGLMLLDLKGYGFLDLDDCRDPDTGEADDWACDLIKRSGSYTELTPSGTGFRIIGTVTENFPSVHTKVPQGDGHVEIYANCDTGRYVTITGQQVECEDWGLRH